MFKSLLRTLPALSGNVKFVCHIEPDKKISNSLTCDDEPVCHVTSASMYPISRNVNQYGIKVNLLSSTYDYDLKNFYSVYADTFYSSQYKYNKSEIEKIDKSAVTNERDKDFEFGCQRAMYSVTGSQFEFFAPVWIDCAADIPDEFVISMSIDNGIYKVNDKKIIIKIKDIIYNKNGEKIDTETALTSTVLQYNTNMLYDYLYRYAVSMNSDGTFSKVVKFNYNEQDSKLNVSNAIYYGIDLIRGGFTNAADSGINYLYYNQLSINSFDNTVTEGFKRHKMALKQIIPLCFSFNIEDILTKEELKRMNLSRIRFSGKYLNRTDTAPYKEDDLTPELYDFSINYSDYNIPCDSVNGKTCKYEYDVTNENPNVMDQYFPGLREKWFWKYRFMNKVSPNVTRWVMHSSDTDITNNVSNKFYNFPYIINNNTAFSICNSSSFKYGCFPEVQQQTIRAVCNKCAVDENGNFYPASKLTKFEDEYNNIFTVSKYLYNFVLPTADEIYNANNDTDDDSAVTLTNRDYYRALNINNELTVFDDYKDIVMSNKFAFNNILYITSDFYNKTVETGSAEESVIDYISNPNNNIHLDDLINGYGVFSGFSYNDLSFSPYNSVNIFDERSELYNKYWSNTVFDTVYHNGMLFDLSKLYNADGFIKKTNTAFDTTVFDGECDIAVSALAVASKNNILNYINNKNIENFEKTRHITKFGVFVLPIMSVIRETAKVFSVSNVFKYIDDTNIKAKDNSLLTYTNALLPVKSDSSAINTYEFSLYNINKINSGSYNAFLIDSNLYIKSDITLTDILGFDESGNTPNIAYWRDSITGTVSYSMSEKFKTTQKYQNLYVAVDDLSNAITSLTVEPMLSLPGKLQNVYYSYSELCSAYKYLSNETDSDISLALNIIDSLININTNKVECEALIQESDIFRMAKGESNELSYNWSETVLVKHEGEEDTEDEQSDDIVINGVTTDDSKSYALDYLILTANTINDNAVSYNVNYLPVYKEVTVTGIETDEKTGDVTYTYYNKVFLNGQASYTEKVSNARMYGLSLYNKDKFVSLNETNTLAKQARSILNNYVTEYVFAPVVKTNTDNVFNYNIMKIYSTEDSFSGTAIKSDDVFSDTNVVWCDPYNMYNVFSMYDLIDTDKYTDSHEAVSNLLKEFKTTGAMREHFCTFINIEHIKKYLSNICCGFNNELVLHPLKINKTVSYYSLDVDDSLYIKENNDANKNRAHIKGLTLKDIPVWPDLNYTVVDETSIEEDKNTGKKTITEKTREQHGWGGPFFDIYVLTKEVVINDNVTLCSKYKYTRLFSYITEKIKEIIEPKYGLYTSSATNTARHALKKIMIGDFIKMITEGGSDYLYSISFDFDVYSNADTKIVKGLHINIEDMMLVYKKDFLRVDENIMDKICNMFDKSGDGFSKLYTDIYFSVPMSDDKYDSIMSATLNKHKVITSEKYYNTINTYEHKYYKYNGYTNVVPYYYEDIIYKGDDSANLMPLYNSVYFEDKPITSIYLSTTLNNIKKCDAYYSGLYPAKAQYPSSVKNYRYNTTDLNNIVLLNSTMLDNFINMYNPYLSDDDNNYINIYNKYLSNIIGKIKIYTKYHSNSTSGLLKPQDGSELDALGLASENLFTYTVNGENYGFYVIGTVLDNTKSSFNMTSVDNMSASQDDDGNIVYKFNNQGSNLKLFYSFNNVPLMKYNESKGGDFISVSGVQSFLSTLDRILPFFKTNITKYIFNIVTLVNQSKMNINIKYFVQQLTDININTNNDIKETNIVYVKQKDVKTSLNVGKTLKRHLLLRYWSYGIPSMVKVSEMMLNNSFNYIYNTKRKNTDAVLLDTGKYCSIGDCVIEQTVNDINEYNGINIYGKPISDSIIKPYNNIVEASYKEPEYKHFNTSVFYQLPPEFIVEMPNKYVYNDILKMSVEHIKKQVFKNYITNYNSRRYIVAPVYTDNIISDSETLFLYSKYKCETLSNSAGISETKERLYTFRYKFTLR